VLTATITNPEKKDAVNRVITGDFSRLWRDIDADEDVRVVVLTGAG
jgi:enoyl-CoA hydratase/carnithine racemase